MSRMTVLADFEGDLKALKKSTKLMRNRDFSNLVHVIEKFHRDVKLSSLTIKERTQLIHLGEDAQFYRILVRMLHEVTITSGIKQKEDLKKVVQWYQTNKEVLHGHPHFKGATKELYKRPNLSFSKDAIKHYSLPRERRNKKRVTISTEQRSKSATTVRTKPQGTNREQEGGGKEGGGGVQGARPLTAPPAPSLHRPKITNNLSSSNNNHKPILEENSFMVNYVNSKLAKYDDYDPVLSRPSSAIGIAKAVPEISEDGSSKAETESQIQTPYASFESIHSNPQPNDSQQQYDTQPNDSQPHPNDSQDNLSLPDSDYTFHVEEGVVELDERGLPKVVYPLPSLISPFGQEDIIEEESYHGGQSPDKRNKSPLKLHVKVNVPVAEKDDVSNIDEEHKSANLQKWKEFKERQAFEQELASKQAFFGRGGDPMGVRYNGHEGGEMPEWYTYDVIASYVDEEGLLHQQATTGEAFQSQELQDFYRATEKYSPSVRPSSSMSQTDRITSVSAANGVMRDEEVVGRGFIPDEVAENMQDRLSAKHEKEKSAKHSVHFESVVDLAGPVSDTMTMHKEMISPEPQLGYRQPSLAIPVKPLPTVTNQPPEDACSPPQSPQSPRSQSIYKMAADDDEGVHMAPPNSSRFSGSSKSVSSDFTQRNKKGEPIILLPQESEYTVHFRRRPRPFTAAPIIPHAISSRQATRTQSSPKYKWGIELPEEDHLNKHSRTKSAPSRRSLRSAGSTSGGRRPRTAIDVSMKQRWNLHNDNDDNNRVAQAASHSSTTMAPKAVASLMMVSHLGGDNRRARSRMGYRGLKGYDENLPGFLPDMQFLSITGPAPMQARGHEDSIAEKIENVPSSTDSQTSSENASTHPQLDNLPTQQWAGLSISSENPEQLSDPFSKRGETDSIAGGDASERSSLLSGVESDRMKDLDDMDSEGGTNYSGQDDGAQSGNDTPRTIDADLSLDLEDVGDDDTPRSTNLADAAEENTIRTIDIDMRSVSQINTEHEDAVGSQMSDKGSVKSLDGHDQSAIEGQRSVDGLDERLEQQREETNDVMLDADDKADKPTSLLGMIVASDENTKAADDAEQCPDAAHTPADEEDHSMENSDAVIQQNQSTAEQLHDEESMSTEGSVLSNYEEFGTEKDILTGAEKADLLSRSFLAVTRHRRVERPSSAHSRLCPTHKTMMGESYQNQGKGRSGSPMDNGRDNGLKSPSMESVRSLPVGLTYMPHADEHRPQIERIEPLMDTPGYPMMPSVAKKPLTPRGSPNASPRSTPVSSMNGSPRDSRESFGDVDDKTSHHFQPIKSDSDSLENGGGSRSTLLTPPNILVRRPTSAPSIRSPRNDDDDGAHNNGNKDTSRPRPTSARHRSVSPHLPSSPRPRSARSPRGLSPQPDADEFKNIRSLSPQPPNDARRPRSASPRSPQPTSANELRVSSPVPQRPASPKGRTGAEWKGRPLNVYGVKDRYVEEEEYRRQQEAKNQVSIQNLFSKSSTKGHKRELNRQEKERQDKKRKEDLERQRNYNEHIWKRDMAIIKHKSPMDKSWERDYMIDKLMRERMRQEKWTAMKQQQAMENRKAQSYLKRIGPTVDIWEMFHGEKRGVSRAEFTKAAILLQKYVRGWIVRSMMKRVIKKSRVHAASFKLFVKYYNTLLKRIARWHGNKKSRIHANLWQMDQFMDRKRYYESVFVNRTHPGDEMEVKEVDLFFKECDHYPSKREIYNAILGATKKDPDKPHLKLKEKDVVETAFMIYVPPGTGLKTENLRSSTWLNPLVEGEEARKLMGSEHVEQTSYLTSIQVVAAARNEHKARELEEIKRQAKKSEEAAEKAAQEH